MDAAFKAALKAIWGPSGSRGDRAAFRKIQGDGSDRSFYRVEGEGCRSVIMVNPPGNEAARRENAAYVNIGSHLHAQGVRVPQIFAHDAVAGWVAMEDMGVRCLHELVLEGADPLPFYLEVVERLLCMQVRGARGFDTGWCCQTPFYDQTVMSRYEAEYFCKAFLEGYLGLGVETRRLGGALAHLADGASKAEKGFFLHRDFQSRNIMWSEAGPGFIDWQGGRLGPLGYDLASLLIDPYTGLSEALQASIFAYYVKALGRGRPGMEADLRRSYPYLAVQRNLQILGAFGFLTRVKGKLFFERYIPRALKTLRKGLAVLRDPVLDPLKELVAVIGGSKKDLDTQGCGH